MKPLPKGPSGIATSQGPSWPLLEGERAAPGKTAETDQYQAFKTT